MDSSSEKVSIFFETSALPKTPFTYGWCNADHKDGKEIRREWRTKDYMKDEPYAASVKAMLKKLGLPFPKPEQIFRGTHHDLLFLNTHGVVVRIGPTDVTDLMNPAILQPLGWLEDKDISIGKVPLTVAVYPGIELYSDWYNDEQHAKSVGSLINIFEKTGQHEGDISYYNKGVIRILDDEGKEASVEVLLDSDNYFNASCNDTTLKRSAGLAKAAKFLENKGDVMSKAMETVFGATENIHYWQRAFEAHQPLRRLFWDAFSNEEKSGAVPNYKARRKFWDVCAQVTNNPQAAMAPAWHKQTAASGKTRFVRKETFIPQVILYHPWTGEADDKIIQPINVSAKLKTAVRKEHTALVKKQQLKNKRHAEPVNVQPANVQPVNIQFAG